MPSPFVRRKFHRVGEHGAHLFGVMSNSQVPGTKIDIGPPGTQVTRWREGDTHLDRGAAQTWAGPGSFVRPDTSLTPPGLRGRVSEGERGQLSPAVGAGHRLGAPRCVE